MLGLIWSVLWKDGEGGEIVAVFQVARIIPRVLEDACLVADVQKISIHRIRLLGTGCDRNAMGFGIGNHFRAAGKLLAEARIAPRGDDLDLGCESRSGEFKANLIVAFACRSVSHCHGPLGAGDLDHALRDERTGDTGAQKILSFVDCTGLQHRENEIARKLLLKVVHIALRGSGFEGLLLESIEFFSLSHISAEGDDFGSVGVFEPV